MSPTRRHQFALSVLLVIISTVFLLPVDTQARPTEPGSSPQGDDPARFLIDGSLAASSSPLPPSKAACDTFYLYGGPGSLEGKFQTDLSAYGGAPDPQGWTSVDLTEQPVYWHPTTTNAATLGGGTPDNHAVASTTCGSNWCGYGNNWDDRLEFRFDVAARGIDPASESTTVRLSCQYVHELEPGYDYLLFEVIRADSTQTLLAVDGSSYTEDPDPFYAPADFDSDELGGIVFSPGDYVDGEVVLRIRVVTDGGWSDQDGIFPTEGRGAAALDDIEVSIDGTVVSRATWEPTVPTAEDQPKAFDGFDNGSASGTEGWQPVRSAFVGDFAKLVQGFSDLDPCASNFTPQWSFIDDGTPPNNAPGQSTGGSTSLEWFYGVPGGWVVNYNGGLTYGETDIRNFIVSPEIEVDLPGTEDDLANGSFGFKSSVWFHSPWLNGLALLEQVRSYREDVGWSDWVDHNQVVIGQPPVYYPFNRDITDLVRSGAQKLQLRFGVLDISEFHGLPGDDATPFPLIDNVSVYKTCGSGPVIGVPSRPLKTPLPTDAFPADGSVSGPIRWDSDSGGVQDSLVLDVAAFIPGTELADPVHGATMRVALEANPLFGDLTTGDRSEALALLGASTVGSSHRGWPIYVFDVLGQQATFSNGTPAANRYFFDLPDGPAPPQMPAEPDEPGLLYPGDVLHVYFESVDTGGNVSTLPTEVSAFLDFGPRSDYWRFFEMRCLPTVTETGIPRMLFASQLGSFKRTRLALGELGLQRGEDFDEFVPGNGGLSGFTGPSIQQLGTYEVLIHDTGSLVGDEAQLLTQWWNETGPRAQFLLGANLVERIEMSGDAASQTYLEVVLGTQLADRERAELVDGQTSPVAVPLAPCFASHVVSYGGCPIRGTFDLIEPLGSGAMPTHEYLDPSGIPYTPSLPVGVWWPRTTNDYPRVSAVFPFPLTLVQSDINGGGPATETTGLADFLRDLMACAGVQVDGSSATPVSPSDRASFLVESVYPNPANPAAQIALHAPARGHVNVQVFDIRGRHVATIFDETVDSGRHVIDWDGRVDTGARAASGVYLWRIEGFGEVVTRRMMVLK